MTAILKKKTKQVASLYLSMSFIVILGIFTSVINTRLLGPQQYGDLKFIQTLFNFVIMFFTMGIFVTGSKMLAQKENEHRKKRLIGSLFIFSIIISIGLSFSFFVFSYFEEILFDNNLGFIIRLFSPLLFVFPFKICLENILQGDNRIYALSMFRLFPSVFYLIGALAINFLSPLSLKFSLLIEFTGGIVLLLLMVPRLQPDFSKYKTEIKRIWEENKNYGFQVYIGIIIGTASAQLGGLAIGYYIDNTNVGFFSLSLKITMPLTLISASIGNTYFKDFANLDAIPRKASIATLGISTIALAGCLILLKPVILFLYTEEYSSVIELAWFVSIGSVFHGFGDFVNRFLGAHGKGKEIRNGAIVTGIFNLFGYTFLIKYFGIQGAAITKMFSGIVYWVMMYFSYRTYLANKNYR